ncbi:MAG: aminoacyl-tRNA hydrolase [Thermoanaerobaculia bacterium]
MRLVAGLGNPGSEYRDTRHNLGFRVIDGLAEALGARRATAECNALVRAFDEVLLVQPQTYMNRSGYSLRCLAERHRVDPEGVLVIYDEVQLPLGRLRFRRRGSPGGHNGMASVIQNLRTEEIARLRLGVGPQDGSVDGEDLVDYVLGPFAADERDEADAMVVRAVDARRCWLDEGPEAVMQRFNG